MKVLTLRMQGQVITVDFGDTVEALQAKAETITPGLTWIPERGYYVSQEIGNKAQYYIRDLPGVFGPPSAPPEPVSSTAGTFGFQEVVPNGGLRVSADTPGKFKISSGEVFVNGAKTAFPARDGLSAPVELFNQNTTVYVYLRNGTTVVYSIEIPSLLTPTNEIGIGVLVSVDGGQNYAAVVPFIVDHSPLTQSLLAATKTGTELLAGLQLSRSSTRLKFDQASGALIAVGRNWFQYALDPTQNPHVVRLSAQSDLVFATMLSTGQITNLNIDTLPLGQYENTLSPSAIGTLSNVAAVTRVTVWRVFQSANGRIVFLHPQLQYGNINEALRRITDERFLLPPNLRGFALVGYVVNRQDILTDTQWNSLSYTRFIPANNALDGDVDGAIESAESEGEGEGEGLPL